MTSLAKNFHNIRFFYIRMMPLKVLCRFASLAILHFDNRCPFPSGYFAGTLQSLCECMTLEVAIFPHGKYPVVLQSSVVSLSDKFLFAMQACFHFLILWYYYLSPSHWETLKLLYPVRVQFPFPRLRSEFFYPRAVPLIVIALVVFRFRC